MNKVINLDLDYDLPEPKEGSPKGPENPTITRNVIEHAFALVNPSMDVRTARQLRSVVRTLDEALAEKKVFVILSPSDFDATYEACYDAKYPYQQAFIVPVLLDELDAVKNRSQKEAKTLLETIESANQASDQVKKVVEMSKGGKKS
jgi:hypothetical protein